MLNWENHITYKYQLAQSITFKSLTAMGAYMRPIFDKLRVRLLFPQKMDPLQSSSIYLRYAST